MMMLLFYIRLDGVESVIRVLGQLPTSIRPTRFTASEGRINKKNMIADEERFCAFIQVNPVGFFLVAPQCVYNLTVRPNDYSIVSVDVKGILNEEQVGLLFEAMARIGADYGFAATTAEYYHRNRIFQTIGELKIESWAGRDLKKYVPGLFWRTMLSQRLIYERGIDLSNLPSCVQVEYLKDDAVLLKVEGGIADWQEYAADLDRFCESTTGFFSIIQVRNAARSAEDFLTFNQIVTPWE